LELDLAMQQLVALEVNSLCLAALANNLLVVQLVDLVEVFQWASLKVVLDLVKVNLHFQTTTPCSANQNYRLQVCLDHPRIINKRTIMQTTDSLMLEAQERNADK
jgi:hypothetical protein